MPTPSEEEVKPKTWSASLVSWFLRNTQIVFLLFLCVIIGGITALLNLRSEGFPSPTLNIAIINDVYPGASPQEVEEQIVKPIETSIQGIKGLGDVTSTSSNSFGSIIVNFDATSDFIASLSEVRNKVQDITLPKDAQKPSIEVPSFGGNISYYAISSENGAATPSLRAQGDIVRLVLEDLSTVKSFQLTQPITDQVKVSWDQGALSRFSLTPTDLQNALTSNNITIPAGTLDLNTVQSSVVTVSPITSLDDLKSIVVGIDKTVLPPRLVHVSDVASVSLVSTSASISDTVGIRDTTTTSMAQPRALVYQLTYKDNVDVLKANTEVTNTIDSLNSGGSLGTAKVVTILNVADSIRDQVKEIENGVIGSQIGTGPFRYLGYILGAIWLIALAMFLFVSWRAALISAAAIPLSILITFVALKLQGISLNTLTLFSMVLVLALIVDPAIVLLESVQRELDLGKKGRNAVIAAMNTVGIGAFIAVVCNVLVFVPFGVVSGVFGEIIRYIPLTVIPALLASYFVPLIFLTYLAQRYLKPKKGRIDDEEIKNLWKSSQWFVKTNTKILHTTWMQIVIIILAIVVPLGVAGSLFATGKVSPVQFSNTSDAVALTVSVEYPANLTDVAKKDLLTKAEKVITDEPGTEDYFAMTQTDNSVQFFVQLFPRANRSADSTDMATEMNTKLASIQNPTQRIFMTAASQGIGGPVTDPVAVNIYGDDLAVLKKAAIQTGNILRAQANVTRVNDGFTDENNPQITISVDRSKLSGTGLPAIAVAGALASIVGSTDVTKYEQVIDGTTRPIDVLLVNNQPPTSVDQIKNLVIGLGANGPIHVKDVAVVDQTQGFKGIQRLNGSRYVTVSAQVKDALKDAAAPQKAVQDFWTPQKLSEFGLRSDALANKGSGDQFLQSFHDLFVALAAALILLYIVLVVFFKSFSQPFIILFAVPLSFIGVFPGLALVGGQFGFLEILGVITLSGIAVNVGIFLIDLANQKRARGMEYKQAIAEASGIRFRPIFLTKVTALGGLLPLIILSPFWRSLATVVLAGVLVSGILSLFTTAILYSWFIGLKERIVRGWERRLHRAG